MTDDSPQRTRVVGGQAFLIVVIAGQGLKVQGERWKVKGREGQRWKVKD